MNTKNNQRYINTEAKITDALNLLLKQKCLNTITVRDICRNAQIHHTTFYEHYSDIFDLIEKTEQRMELGLYERIKKENNINNNTVSLPFIATIINYVKENKDFYTTYLNDYGSAAIDNGFKRVWSDIEKNIHNNNCVDYNKIKYGFEFSKAGALKVIACWLDNGCCESVKEISEILFYLLNYTNE